MKLNHLRVPVVLGLVLLLVQLPVQGVNVPLGTAIPGGAGSLLNGTSFDLRTTLFSGDAITTGAESWVVIQLPKGDQIQLQPGSSAAVSGDGQEVAVALERGVAAARSGNGQLVSISARGLLVRPSATATYQVALRGDSVVVTSHAGPLEVQGPNRTVVVPAGKAMQFVLAANAAPGRTGVGAQNLNEGLVWLVIIAAGAVTGATIAVINHENAENVSPSTP